MVQAAQDDAGEVDGLCEIAHQGALESNHIPPEEGEGGDTTVTFVCRSTDNGHNSNEDFPSQGSPGRRQKTR